MSVKLIWKLGIVPVAEENPGDSMIGRFMKSVLGKRARFLDQTFIHYPDAFSFHEVLGILSYTLIWLREETILSSIQDNPYMVAAYLGVKAFFIAVLVYRIAGGIIVRRRLGVGSSVKLRISTPRGDYVVKKFPLNRKVADVIKWAASKLYGDHDPDVTRYSLLKRSVNEQGERVVELPKFAWLWELDELYERENDGKWKLPRLELVRESG